LNFFRYLLRLRRYRLSGNLSKSAGFEGGGSLWEKISDGRERRPATTVGVKKLEWLPFCVVSKYPQYIVHKARVWQTDGQNYDSQDCATCALALCIAR